MKTRKQKAKFDKIDSGIPGIKAYKPNKAMQIQMAKDMPKEMLDNPLFAEWKKLLEE